MWVLRAGAAVARRPDLWWTAVRQLLVLARPGWWRSAPFLPRPDPAYLRFRLQTMYGGSGSVTGPSSPRGADMVTYLEWCRAWPSVARAR
jgi:hypothetical protein